MPRIGITAYDLLISCPGDVLDYLDVIKESVESFNRMYGVLNNIEVVTKHWSTDSYPQSGDKPQELLNKQFVRDCDAAIAIFWTKFGTPTEKYGSGTEEEIEEMFSVGKQVFMYFLDAPINPSKVDMNQYHKILDFREKYKDRGVYAVIKDKHELQRQFTNHLALHFLPLVSGEKSTTNEKLKPIMQVKDINTLSEKNYSLYRSNLCDSKFINDKKEDILKKIKVLKNTGLPGRVVVDSKESEDTLKEPPSYLKNIDFQKLMGNINKVSGTMNDADISDNWKSTIKDFAEKNEIRLDDDFWNVGDLKKQNSQFKLPFGNSGPSFEGTEEEKERYTLLEELYWDVRTYNEYNEYFNHIDEISVAKLAISNVGNSYDEDIDVKLILPKGYILKHSDLPYPGINIINELLEMRFIDFIFSIEESDTVEKYGYYPIRPPFKDMGMIDPFNQISASEEYESDKEEYRKSLESLFLYRVFENEDNDILTFHIEYLKHNTSMSFPSVLMFKDTPSYIEYEISSKHVPEVLKGKLEFKQE
ncbi:hypothetical protein [Rossellomorea sp. LjRoot5]|uniref:hypothetical protein n=1 Tax=Rossellomorea sp. LjRoot5 TaxID=3342331 RepID=UPI003ECF8911